MFEEVCLACGKLLKDDGAAYCSSECKNQDRILSPLISPSSGSALSSPSFGFAVGADVPALHLNATREQYYSSASSASSTAWSALSDDDDDDDVCTGVGSDIPDEDNSKAVLQGLSYARRPSGTNNRSMVPSLYRRTSSSSETGTPTRIRGGIPMSAPICTHAYPGLHDLRSHVGDLPSNRERDTAHSRASFKPRRTRNRASFPAYFSLLQIGSSSGSSGSSPVPDTIARAGSGAGIGDDMSSSQYTVAPRRSPSTPKAPSSDINVLSVPLPHIPTRCGRRQDHDSSASRSSRRSERSSSESRSRHHRADLLSVEADAGDQWPGPRFIGQVYRCRASSRRYGSPVPKTHHLEMTQSDDADISDVPQHSVQRARAIGERGRRMTTTQIDSSLECPDEAGLDVGRTKPIDRERVGRYHRQL
ncbi:hypothetical protein FISHEDRAFT_62145 [Fistulina hepatica ATCC 64428]|nr:hypothetical protein FISHEDRAFT_62145 [Fistulina hepatica ATCC 64428]